MDKKDFVVSKKNEDVAIEKALSEYAKYINKVSKHRHIVVVNMRLPSYKKRLFVYDLASGRVVRRHHVAHGSKSSSWSNAAYADKFSNKVGSHKSSLGAMITGHQYNWGKYPPSMKLKGLEKGINSNVGIRSVVMHPSKYVTDDYILRNGRAGQSWGCLAVDPFIARSLIDLVKDGSFVYIYY